MFLVPMTSVNVHSCRRRALARFCFLSDCALLTKILPSKISLSEYSEICLRFHCFNVSVPPTDGFTDLRNVPLTSFQFLGCVISGSKFSSIASLYWFSNWETVGLSWDVSLGIVDKAGTASSSGFVLFFEEIFCLDNMEVLWDWKPNVMICYNITLDHYKHTNSSLLDKCLLTNSLYFSSQCMLQRNCLRMQDLWF